MMALKLRRVEVSSIFIAGLPGSGTTFLHGLNVARAVDCGRFGAALSGAPEPDLSWKKRLQEHAAHASDPRAGQDAEARAEREIERLHAKIGELTIENDFFAKRFGR